MIVQHNLQAMNANRMLGLTAKTVSGSTEKLSSGYRINRAADDAAGLAISEKMRKQVRGLTQAAANAEDGVSCVQTAEGALAEVQDMLQRMNELCVQAANGTNSSSDRQYIQDEIDQLISEIDRVAETTKFNETFLLKGEPDGARNSVYITKYSTTYAVNSITGTGVTPCSYKMNYVGSNNIYMVTRDILTSNSSMALGADKIETGEEITKYMTVSNETDPTKTNVGKATLNTTSYVAFMNAELDSSLSIGTHGQVSHTGDLSTDGTSSIVKAARDLYVFNTVNQTITRVTQGSDMSDYITDERVMRSQYRLVDAVAGPYGTSERLKEQMTNNAQFYWTDDILKIKEETQTLYDANGQKISSIKLNDYFNENGNYIGGLYTTAQARSVDEVFASESAPGYINITAGGHTSTTIGKYITQSSSQVAEGLTFSLHVGAQSERKNKITAQIDTLTAAGLGIDKLASYNIGIVDETGDNATDAIDVVDYAIQQISKQRAAMGAVQNRLEHTIKNLDNIVENTTSAEAAIRDTDMAEEMVKYANANILQQAGQSMLAQANQSNQGVLTLLQ